jgi:DTW domain-containing protein YfiP
VLRGCVCALMPRIQTRTHVFLVVHADEADKPTNTGTLALRALPNSSVRVVGEGTALVREPPVVLPPGFVHLTLGMSEDARPLAEVMHELRGQPVCLCVPDGTWRQAHRIKKKHLAGVPAVTLPLGAPTAYALRAESHKGGLATLEAIARALAILEDDPAIEQALLVPFLAFVAQSLKARGRPTGGALPGSDGGDTSGG